MKRFWDKVDKRGPDECWNWTAHTNTKGYGGFRFEGKRRGAHRVSFELHHGPIPDGLVVMHICDNRRCVNPAHLQVGTQQMNIDDMFSKGRSNKASGESHGNSKLTDLDLDILEAKQLRADGVSFRQLGRRYGVTPSAIFRRVNTA